MAILIECPACHKRQGLRNKRCVTATCQIDLDKRKQSGRVRYWIIYRLGKKQIWEPAVNEKGENLNLNDARAAEGKRLGQRKENPTAILNVRHQRMTFNELSEWYLKQEFVKDRKNKERNLKDFNNHFGIWKVDEITNSDLLNYQVKLKKEGKADATVDNKISSIKAVVNQAVRDKKIPRDIADTFGSVKDLLKKDPNTGKAANAKEVTIGFETFNALCKAIPERSRVPLKVKYWTGMREGEVLNLTPGKISLVKRVIELRPEDTKEGKAKEIPIIEEIYPELAELHGRTALDQKIFAVIKDQFIDDVREACGKIGLTYGRKLKDGFTAHSLRHTFHTNAMRANVSQATRMKLTGHSSSEMDDRYVHPQIDDLRMAMERINQFIKSGEVRTDDQASPVLMEILEEVRRISGFVSKSVSKTGFGEQKEVSEISANPLN